MKAITIKQPWAKLIMRCGKDIENREWYTPVRGRVAVTASAKIEIAEINDACHMMAEFIERFSFRIFTAEARGYPAGCILGTVEIVDCVRESDSPWFVGPYGFVLQNPRELTTPIPILGGLGFWDLPKDVEERIAAGLNACLHCNGTGTAITSDAAGNEWACRCCCAAGKDAQ